MNRRAFVSTYRKRAGHFGLKASLSRFNVVLMAECECSDELQTEEHVFWDCKLYTDQMATMIYDILSERSKTEYLKSVKELIRLEKDFFIQGVCYIKNKIPKFI
jgi:hypothetical protein